MPSAIEGRLWRALLGVGGCNLPTDASETLAPAPSSGSQNMAAATTGRRHSYRLATARDRPAPGL